MGDVKSAPKAPKQQIVYVSQPVSPPVSVQASPPVSVQDDLEKTPAQKREATLLSRTRSRVGTILTGFRGILAPLESGTPRKTLLGE